MIFDLRENRTVNVKTGAHPYALAINSATSKASVTHACNCPEGLGITVIDFSGGVESAKVEKVIDGVGRYAAPIALNPDTNVVYVGSDSNSITIIDGSSNEMVGKIEGFYAKDMDVNPKTNTLYAIDGGKTLYKIDGSTNRIVANITVSEYPKEIRAIDNRLVELAVNPNTNVVYLVNGLVIPPPAPNEGFPSPVAYLVAVNGTSNTAINSNITRLGSITYDISVNPAANRIYVSGDHEGLAVLDGQTSEVAHHYYFAVEEGIRGLAIDSQTNKIYLQGQTGIFVVTDIKVDVPEFENFVMLIPAAAVAAAILGVRMYKKSCRQS